MDERAALELLAGELGPVGDDAAVVDGHVLTTDMLHETTDFPAGTTRYTAGWRAVGASLSDVAAMGAEATAAVAVYAAQSFDERELLSFVRGARDVCEAVGASYVGGDLDEHQEFTVVTTALGRVPDFESADTTARGPVLRSGANPGDYVCVTGTLGRSAAALERFDRGDEEVANELFRFDPRVEAGLALAPDATAMMDSSDGLARSLHQLAAASDCGFSIEADRVPVAEELDAVTDDPGAALETALTFGEDFELVVTIAEDALETAREAVSVPVSVLGRVVDSGITLDGKPLADEGYSHG
ncbi:thiamine-phosphate kinase [Halovivax gelatinilyticus]|uniref:thiamine-phosphate kinase n=1 Tax=Halovivax gelatinilyticus TaxID=2961597 RepID=UPI0020CA5B88|nr:thiamine-phosphate kinase [Halovivax gelatinilyticus]